MKRFLKHFLNTQFAIVGAQRAVPPSLILLGILILTACTGLGGEPRIVATLPPATAPPPTLEARPPASMPNIALGAEIYSANCTRCHGANGQGDGELVLVGDVPDPGDFTNPAQIGGQDPAHYYSIITNGNLANRMPPWADALTDEERWAVALYTYTLHYTPEQLNTGAELYAQACVECHGESGRGDGPEAANVSRSVGDLTDAGSMVFVSDDNIHTIIAEGAGADMPAYQNEYNEDQLEGLVAFTRSLSTENSQQTPIPAATEDPQIAAAQPSAPPANTTTARVSGLVTNGTAGSGVPENLSVTLHIVDQDFNDQTIEATTQADGQYLFGDVPVNENAVYFVSTEYQERRFGSSSFVLSASTPAVDVPLMIYDATHDASVIRIASIVSQINPVADVLEVHQEILFTNVSDRVYTTENEIRDGRFASVEIALPVGAVLAGLPSESRFVYNEETFTVTDTLGVLPGSDHRIELFYFVPYDNSAIIEYPVQYNLRGPVLTVVTQDTVRLISEQLPAIDSEISPNLQGTAYGANLSLNPGDLVRYELQGRAPSVGTSQDQTIVTSDNLLPIILIAIGIIVLGISGLIYLSRRGSSPSPQSKDRLIDGLVRQIAELDAQHEAGQINHDLYRQRREQLKARLAEIMDAE